MVLEIVKYGHPVLRRKGARVEVVDAELRRFIADLLETMYAAKGVGLAAQQVGRALQVTVIDVRGASDRPSSLEWEGRPVDPEAHMPLVLLNPEVRPYGETVSGPEGCLSFPEIYADIPRPESAHVRALNERGEPIEFRCGGLLARAVQHEVDHLNGILFIDRMSAETRRALKPQLEELQAATRAALAGKKVAAA